MTGDDLITAIRVGTDNRRGENTEVTDAFNRFHHIFIVYHPEGMSLKGVQFRKRNSLHPLLLGFGS